jgi:molybdopterin-guanine dinucleotide biosynthesis protein
VASNVGKTTLLCRLLERLPGWEAVKVTKGHYRSCGRDPHACCVSHLLSDEPLVLSGRERTYAEGKDTGRYWDAGAANVHWVIAAKRDVARGVREALARVAPEAPGVVVEGTGFVREVAVDCAVMVVGRELHDLKASAATVYPLATCLFVPERGDVDPLDALDGLLERRGVTSARPPVLFEDEFAELLELVRGTRRYPLGRFATTQKRSR